MWDGSISSTERFQSDQDFSPASQRQNVAGCIEDKRIDRGARGGRIDQDDSRTLTLPMCLDCDDNRQSNIPGSRFLPRRPP
ncbi:hypothetical protein NPIL_533231 [Nephila pilipes]|uniref:Uncharacterized protein n=1 Tax=Nephila pilipes TaxID=299642 RepID=A0A8X6UFV3_NEPPI|nr:hypothetical protein NPIL_533231 [Nephila pilipes]